MSVESVGRGARLFHAIVVMGASTAGGCGGKVIFESSGHGAAGTGGSKATGAEATAASTTSTGSTDPCAGVKVGDCANPAQFTCVDCGTTFAGKCSCNATAPTTPQDCMTTADFHCKSYMPPTSCKCVPGSPLSQAACGPGSVWTCGGGYQPPVGCDCIATIAPPPPP